MKAAFREVLGERGCGRGRCSATSTSTTPVDVELLMRKTEFHIAAGGL